jgi:hypothetical protein
MLFTAELRERVVVADDDTPGGPSHSEEAGRVGDNGERPIVQQLGRAPVRRKQPEECISCWNYWAWSIENSNNS